VQPIEGKELDLDARSPVLLVADDEPAVRQLVARLGGDAGFEVLQCANGTEALSTLDRVSADLVVVDLRMPDVNGLDVLRAVRDRATAAEVVLISGYATLDTAVSAIKLGARDCLAKPLDLERFTAILEDVRDQRERRLHVLSTEAALARELEFCGMIGRGPSMQELFGTVRRLAPHARTVLIAGETGTGKELLARAFHRLGPRRNRRFATVNCSTIVESLFETELFGHVRGAFTGAVEGKAGIFEAADHGTLFLDEIGELPGAVQAKLLRVLECGEVQRVGSLDSRTVDVNVIAATNRDLQAEVEAGRFRADLYFRLAVLDIRIPPLRERPEDIPYLVAAFVSEFSKRVGKRIGGVSPEGERVLASSRWAGNVRELRNAIERACMLAQGDVITDRELAGNRTPGVFMPMPGVPSPSTPSPRPPDRRPLSMVEREHVLRVLDEARGNKKAAAEILGISRRSIYRLLEADDRGSLPGN
jgi:DNA-binding NtrC family response regulator